MEGIKEVVQSLITDLDTFKTHHESLILSKIHSKLSFINFYAQLDPELESLTDIVSQFIELASFLIDASTMQEETSMLLDAFLNDLTKWLTTLFIDMKKNEMVSNAKESLLADLQSMRVILSKQEYEHSDLEWF